MIIRRKTVKTATASTGVDVDVDVGVDGCNVSTAIPYGVINSVDQPLPGMGGIRQGGVRVSGRRR